MHSVRSLFVMSLYFSRASKLKRAEQVGIWDASSAAAPTHRGSHVDFLHGPDFGLTVQKSTKLSDFPGKVPTRFVNLSQAN